MFELALNNSTSKDKIIESLITLMQNKSYESITIVELCKEADVSRKTYYRYFYEKSEVLQCIWEYLMTEYIDYCQIKNPSNEKMASEALLELFFVFWQERVDWFHALGRNNLVGAVLVEQDYSQFNDSPNFMFSSDSDPYWIAFIHGGLFAVLKDWHLNGYEKSLSEIIELTKPFLNS